MTTTDWITAYGPRHLVQTCRRHHGRHWHYEETCPYDYSLPMYQQGDKAMTAKAEERDRVSKIVEKIWVSRTFKRPRNDTSSVVDYSGNELKTFGNLCVKETLRQVREMIQSISIQHSIKRLKGKVNPIIVCLCGSYCRAYSDASYVSYREHLEREILSELDRMQGEK